MAKKTQHDIAIKRNRSWDDKLLYSITNVVLVFVLVVVAYPLIYVVSCSFSDANAIMTGRVFLWPVEFTLDGYRAIFAYKSVWTGYANTILYTVCGTIVNMLMSVLIAYPLSRPNYQGRGIITKMCTVTMLISAGLIPNYLLMSNLGLVNSRIGFILMDFTFSTYNMIIIRTYFKSSIPGELIEAARIDGCSELGTLFKIVLPLSKAVLSVVTLYYAVGHWNAYFSAMIYLRKPEYQPLQVILRNILDITKSASFNAGDIGDPELLVVLEKQAELMKYSLIIVSSAPLIAAYPFVQKFFKTGVMIGSVKG